MNNYIVNLQEVGLEDISSVGGKNASLGEMLQHLSPMGIRIPGGFVITVKAYEAFMDFNSIEPEVQGVLEAIDFSSIESLRRAGLRIRGLIQNGKFPEDLSNDIVNAYSDLSKMYQQDATDVAVRSSATAEDLPDASFAGQQETYLNVRGPQSLLEAVRNCFASLFTDRAISYRKTFEFDSFEIGLSVCVQKMVRADLASSGVAFSLDTESGFKDAVVINGSFGLGEMIVQGSVSPDEFIVFKPALAEGYASIIEKKLGTKDKMMVYGDGPDQRTKIISVEKTTQHRFCLSDDSILELAAWVAKIETYYSGLKKYWCPMDVEWAVDGLSGDLFIVQARPETIHSRKESGTITEYAIEKKADEKIIASGIAVGEKIGSGKVNILYSLDKRVIEGNEFAPGDVLVTDMTDPDWEPIMKKASAIITNKGGRTCHAAIVARELGVPAIVGCGNATELLTAGQTVTASCAEGETGFVYEGKIHFVKNEFDVSDLPETKTAVMLNVASPELAFRLSNFPNKGVGLAREEFIINNYIKVHPMALLHHESLEDKELTEQINKITRGYESGEDFFIDRLSFGIARIAAAFYPNQVIVRFSDFKSNEYKNLLGGKYFEPAEENPMIGWRGASRYYSKAYKQAFGMECKAITQVREKMGLKNVAVMIPFCRTVGELLKVKETMSGFGLETGGRGDHGPSLFLMAEIPSNIIMAKEFARHIDGFSIGTNDLTQLTLGLDRDSELVAPIYDERNEAVKQMIRMVISTAKQSGVKVGICGQAPSDYPEFAQFLVEEGIDSISVTPDSILKTMKAISEIEEKMMTVNQSLSAA